MSYQFEWLLPRRVIFAYVSGHQTMAEVRESFGKLTAFIDEGSSPVHFIADLRHMDSMPTYSISELQKLTSFMSHPNLGWVVVVGMNNQLTQYLITFIAKLARIRFYEVDTPRQALDYLSQVDPTVNFTIDIDTIISQIQKNVA